MSILAPDQSRSGRFKERHARNASSNPNARKTPPRNNGEPLIRSNAEGGAVGLGEGLDVGAGAVGEAVLVGAVGVPCSSSNKRGVSVTCQGASVGVKLAVADGWNGVCVGGGGVGV